MKRMDLTYVFYIAAKPERVWKALTEPEDVKKIYWGSVIESTFEAGSPLEYIGPGDDGDQTVHVYGKVLQFKPHKVFSFTHHAGKTYHPDSDKYESRITYTLEPVGKCTKLMLVHDQWTEDDPSYPNSDPSWWMILSNTKSLIETGETLDLEQD